MPPHPPPIFRTPRLLARLLRRCPSRHDRASGQLSGRRRLMGMDPRLLSWLRPRPIPGRNGRDIRRDARRLRSRVERAPTNAHRGRFSVWRDQRDWTARKYATRARSEPMPSQRPKSMMTCPYGQNFDSYRLGDNLVHVPYITVAHAMDGIRR
jgi:hypothetical protein